MIDEFEMIGDGDKILVCVSGSSSSVCLLHFIRQFCRARGFHVEITALTIVDEGIGVDPRALMLYMRDLRVDFIYESNNDGTAIKEKFLKVARRKGFNVIALGNSLDKIAINFLSSILQKGKMIVESPCARDR